MTAKPQNEPTLAEMIQDWRTTVARSGESTDDVYDRCADDLTAFHARARKPKFSIPTYTVRVFCSNCGDGPRDIEIPYRRKVEMHPCAFCGTKSLRKS